MAQGRSVAECQRSISSHEFSEWGAYFEIEPPDSEITHVQIAQLTALIANIHRDPKHRAAPYRVEDFLPRPADAVTWQQQKAQLMALFPRSHGNR